MNEWQPIETAPKDGSYFVGLSLSAGFPLVIVFYERGDFYSVESCRRQEYGTVNLDGWIPLPITELPQ